VSESAQSNDVFATTNWRVVQLAVQRGNNRHAKIRLAAKMSASASLSVPMLMRR